jgi:hypothetical protein
MKPKSADSAQTLVFGKRRLQFEFRICMSFAIGALYSRETGLVIFPFPGIAMRFFR